MFTFMSKYIAVVSTENEFDQERAFITLVAQLKHKKWRVVSICDHAAVFDTQLTAGPSRKAVATFLSQMASLSRPGVSVQATVFPLRSGFLASQNVDADQRLRLKTFFDENHDA